MTGVLWVVIRVGMRCYSPPHEEGWTRHSRKWREASFYGADGVVAHTETLLVSDHPVCGAKMASPKFFDAAATPPNEEGNMPSTSSSTITGILANTSFASGRPFRRVLKARAHFGVSRAPFLKLSDDIGIYTGCQKEWCGFPCVTTGDIFVT
jgi:hypothetical protein